MSKSVKQLILVSLVSLICIGVVFWFGRDFYFNQSDQQVSSVERTKNISAIIVPHHDLVKDKRSSFFKKVSSRETYKTVILASTDHFDAGQSSITTTDKNWKLQNAIILPDKDKISDLVASDLVTNQESAFNREHGITNLLGDINANFPDAPIIPLMIKPGTQKDRISKLNDKLLSLCADDCLLVASVDFSHYQLGALAEIHDSLSIRALSSLGEELILKSETDSSETLLLAADWAKKQAKQKFHLEENTNSGKIENSPDAETTSYAFGWYETGVKSPIKNEMTFMFGGDMMFDRYVQYKFRDDLQESVKNLGERFFWGTDISLINLEGPISDKPTNYDTTAGNLIFNFPPETTKVLKWLHLNSVGLANNHSLNNGYFGLENTKKVLSDNGIMPIGNPGRFGEDSIRTYESENQKITVMAINVLSDNEDITDRIKQEKSTGSYIIVFPHWGSEYQKTHSLSQEKLAHAWIDAGADFVVGSHPHVIQDAEIYQSKPIFYSLGNLLFDQFFSEETQEGLVVAGRITNDKLTLLLLPIKINNLQPELMRGEERREIINRLKQNLGADISQTEYGYDIVEIKR